MRRAEAAHRLHLAEQIVEHVAPVAQHIEDDAAAFGLLVVPARALRRLAPVALEHPVAELAAHREHAAEEAGIAQHRDLAQAGQKQLVLHHAVLHALLLGELGDRDRLVERVRDRLFAIDVLAGLDRLGHAGRRASAWSRRRRTRSSFGSFSAAVRSVVRARDAVLLGERRDLLGIAPDQDRIGHHAVAVRQRTPPCSRIARIERTRCWLSPMRPVTPFMMMPSLRVATRSSVVCGRSWGTP